MIIQAEAVGVTLIYSGVVSLILLLLINVTIGLRVTTKRKWRVWTSLSTARALG